MQKPDQITVLIVGKQTRELKSLKRRLSLEGLEVIRACGHQEVLRQIQEKRPGLVLLNVPQDPVEALQAIHAIKAAAQSLPVIALLRDVAWARGEGGPLAEADDCILAPWRVGELLARFRTQLRIKSLEQELDQVSRSKRSLEAIFEGILDSLEIIDPNYRILRINRTNPGLYGSQPKDFVGRVCYQVYQGRTEPCSTCAVSETLRAKRPAFAELAHNRLREFAHQYTYPLFDEQGALSGVICYVQDVTEKKQMERQLLQAEKLSALGEMISGTAHELNSPLSAILLYSQLLQQAEVGKKIRKGLETIQGEATRCQKIVQHLLSFARQHKPEKKLVNINDILESMLDLQEYQLKRH